MKNRKILLPALLSIFLIFSLILPVSAAGASAAVPLPNDYSISHSTVDGSSPAPIMALNTPSGNVTPMVAAGNDYTVGLKSDGTVVAVGYNGNGECEVGNWTGIVQVAAGGYHTVGLKSDGTVVAVGKNDEGQCNVSSWTHIVRVAAGVEHTVGLKADGTVVTTADSVSGWRGIVQVAAGGYHTVGLKSDGTVVAVGHSGYWNYGQCEVGDWMDIKQVIAGYSHTVGLRSDRTVIAVGESGAYSGTCGWTDIAQVAAGTYYTVGLKSDDTVVAAGDNRDGQCNVGNWTGIVQVAPGVSHTVGLKADGTVVAAGDNYHGQCDVGGWNLGLVQCSLTITSTAGGSVTTPGKQTFTYNAGTVVNLVAEPEEGYRFARWTGDVKTIGNINAAATNITMYHDYSITANFAVPPVKYNLTISSVARGSVTSPGEGTSSYDEGTVVNLVAEAEKGYRFIGWTGDVDTIGDVTAASTTITMNGDYSMTANFENVKAGDWIKMKYTTIGWPEPCPEWMKLEFLSVAGTNATVLVTLHISDGTEESDTVPVDLAEGGGEALGFSGFVIPPNLTTGDSVYIAGFGNVIIAGETTIYAGARRPVVYASLSLYEYPFTYYWDKLTGVMVEAFGGSSRLILKGTVTETNMWEVAPPDVGVKAGDWIKMKCKTSSQSAGQPHTEWLKVEFLSIEGTNATTQATVHISDGTERSDTASTDVAAGGYVLALPRVVISTNLTTGDSVYMIGLRLNGYALSPDYGEVPIKGEATRTYAGANRTVVYASFGSIFEQAGEKWGSQQTYYWDKLTGVLVEQSTTSASGTATTTTTTYKVTQTNMWEATTIGMPWWLWVIVAVAIGAVAFAVYRLKKRKTPTTATPPTEGT
jgi:hypothetical protein